MDRAVIICGPTASGKTLLAHLYALANNGEIINADSMQVYKGLSIITASPEEKYKKELNYHLYNFININESFSGAQYADLASNKILNIISKGKLPIIVGGSGMYINMLINGYSEIPEIDINFRNKIREYYDEIGAEEFYRQLKLIDPQAALRLKPLDKHRVLRAYEVIKYTGKSIKYYQDNPSSKPLQNIEYKIIYILPERKILYDYCDKRLEYLFKNGAIEEVRELLAQYGSGNYLAYNALGVKEISAYLLGEIDINDALIKAKTRTRQYAKRQCTWFNNQLNDAHIVKYINSEEFELLKKEFASKYKV